MQWLTCTMRSQRTTTPASWIRHSKLWANWANNSNNSKCNSSKPNTKDQIASSHQMTIKARKMWRKSYRKAIWLLRPINSSNIRASRWRSSQQRLRLGKWIRPPSQMVELQLWAQRQWQRRRSDKVAASLRKRKRYNNKVTTITNTENTNWLIPTY